ncbi:unnamed protein product [Prunus armeniaca]
MTKCFHPFVKIVYLFEINVSLELNPYYPIKYKSEAFEKFKEFKNEVENQIGKSIKILRSDRGEEYLSTEFLEYLKKHGNLSQWTPPGTPQLNGVSKKRNRTLMDMVQSMMSYTDLPYMEMVRSFGRKPSLNHLKIWGCLAYVKKHDIDKLDARSEMCRFIGYPKKTLGYYFYHPNEQKVFVVRFARFLEIYFALDGTCVQKVKLKEESGKPHEPEVESDLVDNLVPLPTLSQPPGGFEMISKAPDRYLGSHHVLLMRDDMEDPETYTKAMLDIDLKKWQEAMKSEMDSMYVNQV